MTRIQSFVDRMKTVQKKLSITPRGEKRDILLAKKAKLLAEREAYEKAKAKRLARYLSNRRKLLARFQVGGAPSRAPSVTMLAKMENYVRWRINTPLIKERLYRQMVQRARIVRKKHALAKGEKRLNYLIEMQYLTRRVEQSRHLYEASEY